MTWFFIVFVLIFGAAMGSFLNCMAWRLYHSQGLWGRSACPKCHQQIKWHDNIPLISFLFLGGKCRHCHKPISWQYPLVELITALLFLIAWKYGLAAGDLSSQIASLNFSWWDLRFIFRDWLAISFLVIIFIMDWRWYVVLDEISLPAIALLLAANLILGFSWGSLLSAAVVAGGFFALQYVVSRGKWVGGGDIRLGALMGVTLAWPNVLVALMLAYFSGAIVGVALIALKKKELKSPIPFGVFLAPATLVALWWGPAIYNWYLNLLF